MSGLDAPSFEEMAEAEATRLRDRIKELEASLARARFDALTEAIGACGACSSDEVRERLEAMRDGEVKP